MSPGCEFGPDDVCEECRAVGAVTVEIAAQVVDHRVGGEGRQCQAEGVDDTVGHGSGAASQPPTPFGGLLGPASALGASAPVDGGKFGRQLVIGGGGEL